MAIKTKIIGIDPGTKTGLAVEKYAAPQPGEFLHRSDLLRTKDILKSLLR